MTYTIIIAICRIGAIWAKNKVVKKAFMTGSTLAVMMAILELNNDKKEISDEYNDRPY